MTMWQLLAGAFGYVLIVMAIKRYRWRSTHYPYMCSHEQLETTLNIIRQYTGFNDEWGLLNGEIEVRAHWVNPYGDAKLSYLIFVPKRVLTYARYQDSKLKLEEVLGGTIKTFDSNTDTTISPNQDQEQ